MLFTKNPSDQNSPPHSCFFTSGCFSNIFLAVILFIILIISVTLYFGTDCIRKCTWSLSVPISKKLISYLLEISRDISLRVSSSSLLMVSPGVRLHNFTFLSILQINLMIKSYFYIFCELVKPDPDILWF